MTKHRWLAPLVVCSLVVAACGGSPASSAPTGQRGRHDADRRTLRSRATGEQTLNYVIDSDLSGGLTNAADNVPTAEAAQFMFDGIYEFDEGLTAVPDLAEDLATISEDGLTWTIKLRSGVKFHDGTDLTADDVVQTVRARAQPELHVQPGDLPRGLPREGREGRRPDGRVHAQAEALDLRDDLPARDRHREQGRDRRVLCAIPRGSPAGQRGRDQGHPGQGRRPRKPPPPAPPATMATRSSTTSSSPPRARRS